MAKQKDYNLQLARFRKQIDQLDDDILHLLAKRTQITKQVGKLKSQHKLVQLDSVERESLIIDRVLDKAEKLGAGTFPISLEKIFREIISMSYRNETLNQVAYLGPEGTYSHEAVLRRFGHAAVGMPVAEIVQAFEQVANGNCAGALVPLENSHGGSVADTLDALWQYELQIRDEYLLPISHNILFATATDKTAEKFDLRKVKYIYAHNQSFLQCRKWLAANCPQAVHVPAASNGYAAQLVAKRNRIDSVAIGSLMAAQLFGLKSKAKDIQAEQNLTRFIYIGAQDSKPTGNDRTSFMMIAAHKPGSILHLLEPLATNKISMSKLESRPLRGSSFAYVFFVDIDAHRSQPRIKRALAQIEKRAAFFKLLGSYPCARLPSERGK